MCFLYLQTEHFDIRQWKLEDAPALWQIMSDSRVHLYTGDKPWTLERATRYIQSMLDKDFRTLEAFHGACVLRRGGTSPPAPLPGGEGGKTSPPTPLPGGEGETTLPLASLPGIEGGTLIGYTGLNPYLPRQPELEWQLGVPYWGKGYATEIGRAVIEAAFASTDIERIFGMVNPQNKASLRVMEKIGMTCLGLREFRGEMDMFYQIERGERV